MAKSKLFSSEYNRLKLTYKKFNGLVALFIIIAIVLVAATLSITSTTRVLATEKDNIALHKRVIANDALNVPPTWQSANLTDGVTTSNGFSSKSYSSLNSTLDAFVIDLGSSLAFNTVVLYPRTDISSYVGTACNFPEDLSIQASDNENFSNFTTLESKTGLTTVKDAPVTITFAQGSFRYLRLHVTKLGLCETKGGDSYVQLAEFEIFNLDNQSNDQEKADAVTAKINALPAIIDITLNNKIAVSNARKAFEDLTDAQKILVSAAAVNKLVEAEAKIYNLESKNSVNIALNKTVIASAIDSPEWQASNLTDGIATNCFSTSGYWPQNTTIDPFVIDLGVSIPINSVTMYPRAVAMSITGKACNFPENFAIQASDNAEFSKNVKTLATRTGVTPLNTQSVTVFFTEFTARYVRLHVTKLGLSDSVSGDSYIQLAEFEVYSSAGQDIIDYAIAFGVNEKLKSLPTTVTSADSYTVYNAKSMFDNLTPSQKLLIDSVNLAKLNKAESDLIIAVYDQNEVRIVLMLIKKIPSSVAAGDAYKVNAAKAQYDALSEVQKNYISNSDINTLNAAVLALANL